MVSPDSFHLDTVSTLCAFRCILRHSSPYQSIQWSDTLLLTWMHNLHINVVALKKLQRKGDCRHHFITLTWILKYHTVWFLKKSNLENFANAAEVDLVSRLLPALAPDRGEEECPGVAVAGVAVRAQAHCRRLCFQLPLFTLFLLLCLPVSFVPGRREVTICTKKVLSMHCKLFLKYFLRRWKVFRIWSSRRSFWPLPWERGSSWCLSLW